jgi:pyruvate dehydrogenase E1 component alpha subunit
MTAESIDDAWEQKVEAEVTAEIGAAIKAVEEMPPPPRESLFDDVYSELPWHLKEQRAILESVGPAPSH